MIYAIFEGPRSQSVPIKRYAVIYRSLERLDVIIEADGQKEIVGRDPTVSRRIPGKRDGHAEIYEKAGSYYIRDLGSKNGTLIDGLLLKSEREYVPTEAVPVSPGQSVRVGYNTLFRVEGSLETIHLPAGSVYETSIAEAEAISQLVTGASTISVSAEKAVIKLPSEVGRYSVGGKELIIVENPKGRSMRILHQSLGRLNEALDAIKDNLNHILIKQLKILNMIGFFEELAVLHRKEIEEVAGKFKTLCEGIFQDETILSNPAILKEVRQYLELFRDTVLDLIKIYGP